MAGADTYRFATWNVELWRKGPGLLLRDLLRGDDPQIEAILSVLSETAPDVIVLQGVDFDLENKALTELGRQAGYPYVFALRPNAGRQTGLDRNGNGRLGEAEDALGYGAFSGQGGMGILSRFPFGKARDLSQIPWNAVPGNLLPEPGDWPSEAEHAGLPLSSMAHWIVPVTLPEATLTLMTFHAQTPVFDGPEDRNGRRNHDEIRIWQMLLDGSFGPAPKPPFVLLGQANQDPNLGEGRKSAIRALLADPRLQDPMPTHPPTVDWPKVAPSRMRVSYILPSTDLTVARADTDWTNTETRTRASRHRLVWVDIDLP